jgi:hypothetical protein
VSADGWSEVEDDLGASAVMFESLGFSSEDSGDALWGVSVMQEKPKGLHLHIRASGLRSNPFWDSFRYSGWLVRNLRVHVRKELILLVHSRR